MLSCFLTTGITIICATTANAADTISTTNSVSPAIPLEIEPICSSNLTDGSYWKVTNKNDTEVAVGWNKIQSGNSGQYTAPGRNTADPHAVASVTVMETVYDEQDRNNTTAFTFNGTPLGTTNARDHRDGGCEAFENTTPSIECIDGRIQQNIVTTWIANNSVAIKTTDGKPLCENVTVYFSSYTMPDNYNGEGFYDNPTAYPQPIFSSTSATLEKGTDGATVLSVDLPHACKNTQVDIYYAPEVTLVGQGGHGTQNIESKIYEKDGGSCEKADQGTGSIPTTSPVLSPDRPPITPHMPPTASSSQPIPVGNIDTKTPVVNETDATLPSELPSAGSGAGLNFFALMLASTILVYGAVYRLQNRFRNKV